MARAYRIVLTPDQRQALERILRAGQHAAHVSRHARILLEADAGVRRPRRTDVAVAERCGVSSRTVARMRERFAVLGFDVALHGKPRRGGRPKLTAVQDACVIALACSAPPAGYAGWSLRLLARHVELIGLPSMSPALLARTLKKSPSARSNPGGSAAS
jgi:hypothetical protein